MNPTNIPIVGMIVGLLFGLGFGISAMYFSHRRRALWHETVRIALEKGQPIPASLDAAMKMEAGGANWPESRWRGYLVGGLINLGIGAGLYVAFSRIPAGFNLGYIGAIPAFIGIALVIAALVEGLAFSRSSDRRQD